MRAETALASGHAGALLFLRLRRKVAHGHVVLMVIGTF